MPTDGSMPAWVESDATLGCQSLLQASADTRPHIYGRICAGSTLRLCRVTVAPQRLHCTPGLQQPISECTIQLHGVVYVPSYVAALTMHPHVVWLRFSRLRLDVIWAWSLLVAVSCLSGRVQWHLPIRVYPYATQICITPHCAMKTCIEIHIYGN